ncbi:hypothetical protein DAI22_03g013000 [Oryza sativa Japonica Group]|nr:hypothetical protein DAI22_03g013000 [Oryza sativa Japonica Group]
MFGPKPLQLACNCKRWRDFLMRSDRFGLVFCRAESHTVRHAHAHCVALRGAATEPPKRAMFIQWDYPRRNPTLSTAPRATAPVRSNRGERERGGDGRRSGAERPHHPRAFARGDGWRSSGARRWYLIW